MFDTVDAVSGAVRKFTAARTTRRKNTVKHTEADASNQKERAWDLHSRQFYASFLPTRDMLHDVYV